MIESSISFAKIANPEHWKLQSWLPALIFVVYLPIWRKFMRFMRLCQTHIKILYAFEQGWCVYAGNLVYGVRLQVNMREWLVKTFFIKRKKIDFMSYGYFQDGSLMFNSFIVVLPVL